MVDEPLAAEPVVEPAVPPVETAQTPVHEPLSEPIPEPTPEASAGAPSEPAEPVSEAAEPAAKPRSESSESEPKSTPVNSGAATVAPAASATRTNTPEHNRELLVRARATRQMQKQQKLDKIMTELEKRGTIINNEVEKLLRCSDATATRYLEELIRQGKIKRVGVTGSAVHYIKA